MNTPGATREGLAERVAATLVVLVLASLVAVRVQDAVAWHILWLDRDLARADVAFTALPTTGAEMNYGGGARVPGGAWYLLLWLPRALGADPDGVYRFLLGLDVLAAASLGALIARRHGRLAGALTAALYLEAEAREAFAWVWNPTGLPVFVVASSWFLAHALDRGGRGAYFGWAFSLALGAQLHLTAASWLVITGIGLLALRPRATLRALPAVAAAITFAYLPYLLDEALHGFPNTRALASQGPVRALAEGHERAWQPEEGLAMASWLLPVPGDGSPLGQLARAAAGAGAILTGAWSLLPSRGARDDLRVLAAGAALVVAHPALSASVEPEWRYVTVALPAFAALAGVGLAALATLSRRLLGTGLPGAACAAALALAAPVDELQARSPRRETPDVQTWRGVLHVARRLEEARGWSLQEVSGRTVFARLDHESLRFLDVLPVDHALRRDGLDFPGSLTGPCAAVIAELPRDAVVPPAALAALLGRPSDEVVVQETLDIDPTTRALVYEAPGPCGTTMTDRYLDTPVEAVLRPLWDQLAAGAVRELPSPAEGARRVAVALEARESGRTARLLLGVDLHIRDRGLEVVVHGNQLRGHAYNAGWFQDGLVEELALILTPAGGPPTRRALAETPVGLSRVVTPFASHVDSVASGTWAVALSARVHVPRRGAEWPLSDEDRGQGTMVEVSLLDEFVVP